MTQIIRLLALGVPGLILAIALGQSVVDPKLLFLDPMVAADVSGDCCYTYYGIVSTLGVLMWIATAAVCLFAAFLLWKLNAPARAIGFALLAGVLSGWLGFDDGFLFHENIAPKIGVPQTLVLAIYLVLAAAYSAFSIREILKADVVLFGLAGVFLLASLGVDVVLHSTNSTTVSIEDGAKFLGISCWMAFHVTAMMALVRRHLAMLIGDVPTPDHADVGVAASSREVLA